MFGMKDRYAYFVSRHVEETAAADAAITREARIAHLELALRYSLLAAQDNQLKVAGESASRPPSTAWPPR